MQHQAFQLDAVLLRKSQRALEHGILHDVQNFGIIDGLVDVFAALVTAQIRAGRVAHVVDVQLTLDVEIKRLERNHVRNFRDFALERGLIDRQEAVALDADAHRVAVLHFFCLHRHHPSDGGFHQTDTCAK